MEVVGFSSFFFFFFILISRLLLRVLKANLADGQTDRQKEEEKSDSTSQLGYFEYARYIVRTEENKAMARKENSFFLYLILILLRKDWVPNL